MSAKADRRKTGDKLRETSQRGYDALLAMLREDCVDDLVAQLEAFKSVEDVMREVPVLVPILLDLAWNMRTSDHLSSFFVSQETNSLTENRDAPLVPCGRSYAGVVHGHLLGSARLHFSDKEKSWCVKEARKRTKEYESLRLQKKRNPFGFVADLLRSLFNKHPVFFPGDMRPDYKSHGLYPALKRYLLSVEQFQLIPAYATLNVRQVSALGPLLRGMHSPDAITAAADYDSRQLAELARCARLFAKAVLSFSETSSLYAQPERPLSSLNEGVERDEVLAGEVLSRMVVDYEPFMSELLNYAGDADAVITNCSIIEGQDVWKLFGDKSAIENIAYCPEEVVLGVGGLAGHITESVANIFQQFDNPTIPRDLLILALEHLDKDTVISWLSDDMFLPVWEETPSQFNGVFTYSRDSEVPAQKNISDLKVVASVLFKSFRQITNPSQPEQLAQAA